MTAKVQRRRKYTAKYFAEKMGICERHVYNLMAESRADYEKRAEERRNLVAKRRAEGVPLAKIAEEIGGTVDAVKSLYKQARRAQRSVE